ncbi:MAG TPA: Holliday junction resolvase RuvX [Pyrinomonadaceae bacterium]|nr:Holliday junction resolvase RuvX [Pyrinomonadaceae bacterium]
MENGSDKNFVAPVLALDIGQKRVGAAVSDSLAISITRLKAIPRSNWKHLLREVDQLITNLDAKTLVIGLPLRLNGSAGKAAEEITSVAEKFAKSVEVPVYLQDERLSSREAEENLRDDGRRASEISELVDSEAAAVILRDFLETGQHRMLVRRESGLGEHSQ